jgi:hypothetical protein
MRSMPAGARGASPLLSSSKDRAAHSRQALGSARSGLVAAPLRAGIVVAALLVAAPAAADGLPSGFIGPIIGVRAGVGSVQSQFGLGALWGVEAGWQPMRPRAIFSGYYSANASSLTTDLRVIEMDAGAYGRFAVGRKGGYFDVGAGWSVLRANVPLAPKDQRSYTGPYAAVALEKFISDSTSASFELRVGEVALGPATWSAIFGLRFGI